MSRKLVGTIGYGSGDEILCKRAALLFDEIRYYKQDFKTFLDNDALADFLIGEPSAQSGAGHDAVVEELTAFVILSPILTDPDMRIRYIYDAGSRGMATELQRSLPDDVVVALLREPLLPGLHDIDEAEDHNSEILTMIMERLPLPEKSTPWEAILDWRSDEDARMKFRRLRSWIARTARLGLSAPDAILELETLADDYQTYMTIQHKKLRRSRVEVIVTTTAEIAEDLLHVRLSKAASKLFGMLREETQLSEAELTAPGREIAYLVDVNKRWKSSR